MLARGLLEGPMVGADDGDLGVAVDVAEWNVRVVVSAVVQLRREVDELGGSFFPGSGAVVQGVLQESLSWSYAGTSEPAGEVGSDSSFGVGLLDFLTFFTSRRGRQA
ncbi:hypothetical protein Csp2054_01565 [Curtobacterium sp. 'Ferrero']|nr:hypothetical protein Csp2054_01565 [Curtobacterium sp. 'Ferrero']